MTDAPLRLCFGVHNHQPMGNFDGVFAEATERAYRPFLERLAARPEVRVTVHCSGSLLLWLREHGRAAFDLLGEVVARGQVEILTGGFYEPILAILPDRDKRSQIERLSEFLGTSFGVRPRGMWLAERVWEPHLPRVLREAGVEYVLVDDSHFALAGVEPDTLGGYYLTEEQGHTLGVFPISQRLRYLIPFAEVGKTLEYLGERRDRVTALTVVDDGEKFGVWPGTWEHVYRDGWLDRFFDRLLGTPWLRLSTLGEVVDAVAPTGRVYLPTASYREMGEWALPAATAEALDAAKHELAGREGADRFVEMLRGGFWRGFLVKYPEVGDTYWKMVRLSEWAAAAPASAPPVSAARDAILRGQANDAYWHGVFGGCYLPHLRRAVKSALLEAEAVLDAAGLAGPAAVDADVNGDGAVEVTARTRELVVTLHPARGGSVTEIGYLPRALDLADVLTRRREAYHAGVAAPAAAGNGTARTIHDAPGAKEAGLAALLAYDDFRRASLLDGLFGGDGELDPVAPWKTCRAALGGVSLRHAVAEREGAVTVTLTPADAALPIAVDKRVTVSGPSLEARYRLSAADGLAGRLDGRWAVQWNLVLTAGDAPGRYLTLPGRPSLGSAGRVNGPSEVTLVDEWIGVEARLSWSPGAALGWGPVQTVSVSEAGFERIYQGIALLLVWPLDGPAHELWTRLEARCR
ncbi:MAG: alpha-amylase/4-alpha-glucanotransferase domain-containing protein [Candidatus Rokuibacteriota bacterium]